MLLRRASRPGLRCFAGYAAKRAQRQPELAKLPELVELQKLRRRLQDGPSGCGEFLPPYDPTAQAGPSDADVRHGLDAALLCFALHAEARAAAFLGEGFYTIGPCGEECLSGVGLALQPQDAAALHYRHLATLLARQLQRGADVDQLVLDRARGFCVSSLDPVSAGGHCLLGGDWQKDFLVTSTLASQAGPAVGRALGLKLADRLRKQHPEVAPRLASDAVSYVSVGDGSVNNAHFLSAVNLAEYSQHRGFKCPVVFGVSDNGVCISLKGYGWLEKFLAQRLGMPVFPCDGRDFTDVFNATSRARHHAQKRGQPACVVFRQLPRRFGHAATDRQDAYLSPEEIHQAQARDVVAGLCAEAVRRGVTTYPQILERFDGFVQKSEDAFARAAGEPKLASRQDLIARNSAPLAPSAPASTAVPAGKKEVQRKWMTKGLDDLLAAKKNLVYIGEDVQHGGYYLVTSGLHAKYPLRVADFPPDETSLVGAGVGYAQAGLVPIVEIPYAKYLDCGADAFFEACCYHWLSNGQQPSGLVIRLQGFDKGVFGGNFHTHNSLHLPVGLDVVCYSNGPDWVRGMRYLVRQAEAGRVCMSVDPTALLNERHLHGEDHGWTFPYPEDGEIDFDFVRVHGEGEIAVVTYGNGVRTALRAAKLLAERGGPQVAVIDSPYLSKASDGLRRAVAGFDRVVFADCCKRGQHPLAGIADELQSDGLLKRWRSACATPTYNPLGSTVTFLSEQDIAQAVQLLG